MEGIIASAVVLPEPQETNGPASPPQSPTGQKRRQSAVAEHDAKRPRLVGGDNEATNGDQPSTKAQPPTAVPGRRERGRERRLFGAVLGALSQNSTSAAQRKRSEIEKRQRAQREQEEQEDGQRKAERIAQRKTQRRIEQKRFEKESIRIRHANLRHMANFLRTKTEPQLYYKPWETTEEEDERIQAQIAEAEETIRRELEESQPREDADEQRKREQYESRNAASESSSGPPHVPGKDQDIHMHEASPTRNGTNGRSPNGGERLAGDSGLRESHAEAILNGLVSGGQTADADHINGPTSHGATTAEGDVDADANKEAMDDNGDEMVEAAEDTVIY